MAKVIRPQPPMSPEAEAYSETAFKLSEEVLRRARAMLDITYGPHEDQALEALGLVDTGSTVNVLPYHLGLQLGALWNPSDQALELTGNLAQFEARPLIVTAQVADYPPIRLAFAWTKAEQVPVILGQVNFFLEFDVCIFRSQGRFEVRPRSE